MKLRPQQSVREQVDPALSGGLGGGVLEEEVQDAAIQPTALPHARTSRVGGC